MRYLNNDLATAVALSIIKGSKFRCEQRLRRAKAVHSIGSLSQLPTMTSAWPGFSTLHFLLSITPDELAASAALCNTLPRNFAAHFGDVCPNEHGVPNDQTLLLLISESLMEV